MLCPPNLIRVKLALSDTGDTDLIIRQCADYTNNVICKITMM